MVCAMARKLLSVLKPPKPVSEMTDEERDAYAGQLFEAMKAGRSNPSSAQPASPRTPDVDQPLENY